MALARRQTSMPRSYQGSAARYILGKSAFNLRQSLKWARRAFARRKTDSQLNDLLSSQARAIKSRDWDAVLRETRAIAAIAEEKADPAVMTEMAKALARLGVYEHSARLALAARHLRKGQDDKEWNGQDISGRILLIEFVEDVKQGLGGIIRYAPLLAPALSRARRSIIVTEQRLAPLLKRTFPAADVRMRSEGIETARDEADVFAGFEQLAYIFADDAKKIETNFAPLKADPELTRHFRERYSRAGTPLIGLSWGSKSYNKDVPDLREWSHFIRQMPAQFVSLQYGKVPADLPTLTGADPARIIHDTSVDQLKDMDRFAAQISALDAVVSISNTAAHFAGALGVPSIFLIDDKFHTNWPVIGETVPWYPQSRIVLKNGRDWPVVLEEVEARLKSISKKRAANRQAVFPASDCAPKSRRGRQW